MSTQSYYKDRLGFDPREALYDGAPTSQSPSQKNGSRARSVPHQYTGASPNNGNHYEHSVSPSKKQKQSSNNNNSQGGYEDALTQFKGTMSLWDYFVENWDITGMFWKQLNERTILMRSNWRHALDTFCFLFGHICFGFCFCLTATRNTLRPDNYVIDLQSLR